MVGLVTCVLHCLQSWLHLPETDGSSSFCTHSPFLLLLLCLGVRSGGWHRLLPREEVSGGDLGMLFSRKSAGESLVLLVLLVRGLANLHPRGALRCLRLSLLGPWTLDPRAARREFCPCADVNDWCKSRCTLQTVECSHLKCTARLASRRACGDVRGVTAPGF